VYPKNPRIINDMNIDIGIANPTKSAFLKPRKNIKTVTTSITPKIILFVRSFTRFVVSFDWSLEIETSIFAGNLLPL
jgi:hypothetical protein